MRPNKGKFISQVKMTFGFNFT